MACQSEQPMKFHPFLLRLHIIFVEIKWTYFRIHSRTLRFTSIKLDYIPTLDRNYSLTILVFILIASHLGRAEYHTSWFDHLWYWRREKPRAHLLLVIHDGLACVQKWPSRRERLFFWRKDWNDDEHTLVEHRNYTRTPTWKSFWRAPFLLFLQFNTEFSLFLWMITHSKLSSLCPSQITRGLFTLL